VEESARGMRAAEALEGAVASWHTVLTTADAALHALGSGKGALDKLLADKVLAGLNMGDVARLLHLASCGLAFEIVWQQPFAYSSNPPAAIVSEYTFGGCRIPHLSLNQVKLCLHHPTTRVLVCSAGMESSIANGEVKLQGLRLTSYHDDTTEKVVLLELCESPLTFSHAPACVPPKPATSRLVLNFDEDEVQLLSSFCFYHPPLSFLDLVPPWKSASAFFI
jgi:hypothetical protein